MALFEWPPDLERRVVGLSLGADEVVARLRQTLRPHRPGSTGNPFFHVNEEVTSHPALGARHDVPDGLPPELVAFYRSYGPDVEWRCEESGLVLFSAREMLSRRPASDGDALDLGYVYAGMGHVMVHTFMPRGDRVVSCIDGGSCGISRAHHAVARQALIASLRTGAAPPDDAPPYCTLARRAWWCEQLFGT